MRAAASQWCKVLHTSARGAGVARAEYKSRAIAIGMTARPSFVGEARYVRVCRCEPTRLPEMEWLLPGATCWKNTTTERFSLLVDGQRYFAALRKAAIAAQRSILIIGWDVDTRTCLQPPGHERDGYPSLLLEFLKELLERKPELHIHVLAWDFSMIYTLERELMPSYRFAKDGHARLHYVLDSEHPVGASHHQKIVVIDDQIAFVGGYDLTIRRWDTEEHRPDNPQRVDPNGVPYEPMHDVQVAVQGEAAAIVGELARLRWQAATQEKLAPPHAPKHELFDFEVDVAVEHASVGIVRTQPSLVEGGPDVREVLNLTLSGIREAQRLIYIENQYFTSAAVADALAARLGTPQCPQIVLVLPQAQSGWLERSSMGVLRVRALERLRQHDRYGRVHVYVPVVSGVPIQVHSKLILIDDQLLKVGSANLSNRSMGFDTECDIALAAREGAMAEDPICRGIRQTLAQLLGEHLGLPSREVLVAAADAGTLVALIESRRGSARCLEPLEDSSVSQLGLAGLEDSVADPERPLAADDFMRTLLPVEVKHPARRSLLGMLALVSASLALVALMSWTSLSELGSVERVSEIVASLRDSSLSLLYLSLFFVLATLVFCPITLLIGATVLVFDPVQGFAHAMVGSLSAAAASYWVGRRLGPAIWRSWATPRLLSFRRRLRLHGFRATVIARVLPVGNFTMINLMAGAVPVQFTAFLLGNVMGLLPGVLSLTLLARASESDACLNTIKPSRNHCMTAPPINTLPSRA